MTTQARSSYLVNEILWGHRFEKLITFQKEDGTYKIDYSRFDVTVPIDTPTCSAKEWMELREQEKFYTQHINSLSTPSIYTAGSTSFLGASGGNFAAAANNNPSGGDLRKRSSFTNRNDTLTVTNNGNLNNNNETENNTGTTTTTRVIENFGNAIKMVIEDHSNLTRSITNDSSPPPPPLSAPSEDNSVETNHLLTFTTEPVNI